MFRDMGDDRYARHLQGDMTIVRPPTIERSRRCQNCLHWDNGPRAKAHYEACRDRDMQAKAEAVLAQYGREPSRLEKSALALRQGRGAFRRAMDNLGVRFSLGDQFFAQGVVGQCRIGASPGTFIHALARCENPCRWTARVKPDGAELPDESGDEARERLGLKD